MKMATNTTQEYVVVRSGMTDKKGKAIEEGTTLELTEAQAKSRVGKVALKSEAGRAPVSNAAKDKEIAELKANAEKFNDFVERANSGGAKMQEQIDTLTKANAGLEKDVESMTAKKADASLKKQLETALAEKAGLEKQVADLTEKAGK